MFCPKCHTDLNEKANYCKRCGTKVNSTRNQSKWSSFSSSKTFERMNIKKITKEETNRITETQEKGLDKEDHNPTHEEQYKENYNYSNIDQTIVTSDEDYIQAYMGKDFKINPKEFSLFAAALGPFYLIYRKMYKQAFIMIILYIITYIYLPDNLGIITRLSFNLILGRKANTYYYQEAINKVEMIKENNNDSDSKELIKICSQKGGHVPILIVVLLFFLYITCIAIGNININNQHNKELEYSIYSMNYKITPTTEIIANHENYKHFTDNQEGLCSITITGEKNNLDEKEYYLTMQIDDDYTQTNMIETKINNIPWLNATLESQDSIRGIYITKNEEIIYVITFDSFSTNACEHYKNNLLQNIEFK